MREIRYWVTKEFISKVSSGDRGASPGECGHRDVHPVESRAITPQGRGCVLARAVGIATLGEDEG